MDYLSQLNESQRKAVEATEGPVMVIAGAGSGKTRVLTYRIAHLINKGVDAFHILSLTFTNKAAKEMKERIGKIVGFGEARNIWMGTFHSVFARILRAESEKIGYPSNFTIYDTSDSKSLIKAILKDMNLDEKIYKPGLVLNRISSAKSNLISSADYNRDVNIISEDRQMAKPKLGEIYATYESRCFKASAMDFDDLLFKTNILLSQYPEILLKYQERFRYILVDEYQDTNFSQYVIVKKLAARYENICVVGDDAQSIYAFRGANIQNILNFKKDYPDFQTFKLEQNYRSTKNIVNAANSVISHNKDQIEKEVWTDNTEGEKLTVYCAATDNEEGKYVAEKVFERQMNNQLSYDNFAVLYRTNAQSRALEEALRKKNIPYRIYGGLSFYQRKEIKDLLAYFRVVINPDDEEALKRIINYPARGIGKTTIEKILLVANENEKSAWEIITHQNQYPVGLNSGARSKLDEFATMINLFRQELTKKNGYDLGVDIATQSGLLKELYSDRTPEGVGHYENLQELLNGLKDFTTDKTADETDTAEKPIKTLPEYMADIALLTDADVEEDDTNFVSLMTVHMSKGLEFPHIFIVGMEDNLFPSQMAINTREELEEERRLFYVAITRAKHSVTISYTKTRFRWGQLVSNNVSRFLEEINPKFIDRLNEIPAQVVNNFQQERYSYFGKNNQQYQQPPKQPVSQPPLNKNLKRINAAGVGGSDYTELQTGMEVTHKKFGNGKVIAIEGAAPNQKATVFFQGVGQKELLLKYAKLEVKN